MWSRCSGRRRGNRGPVKGDRWGRRYVFCQMLMARANKAGRAVGQRGEGWQEATLWSPGQCSCWREQGASSPGVAEKNRGDREDRGDPPSLMQTPWDKNWRLGSSLVLPHWGQNPVPCAGWARVPSLSRGPSLFVSFIHSFIVCLFFVCLFGRLVFQLFS